jgi:hypothetical protein
MKSKLFILSSFVLLFFIAAQSCGHKHDHNDADAKGKEYTSAYICPMHCEGSGSDKAGTCPACGMDYVVNEDYDADSHDHDGEDNVGDGHDHDGEDHEGHNH